MIEDILDAIGIATLLLVAIAGVGYLVLRWVEKQIEGIGHED